MPTVRETWQALEKAAVKLHSARRQMIEIRKDVVRQRYGINPLPLDRTPLNRLKRIVAECLKDDPYSIRKAPHARS